MVAIRRCTCLCANTDETPIHRRRFQKDFQSAKEALWELIQAKSVEIFMGSGTLANDIMAAQLSRLGGTSSILTPVILAGGWWISTGLMVGF